MDFDLKFSEEVQKFNLEFESSETEFDLINEDTTIIPVCFDNDHRLLTHRNDDDQHTIESITGLQEELESSDESLSRLDEIKLEEKDLNDFSNMEIQYLWNKYIK